MTLRWRYAIHTRNVGSGSLETSGGVATVEEIAQIARSNPEKKIEIYAPLDETSEETAVLLELGVERMFPPTS